LRAAAGDRPDTVAVGGGRPAEDWEVERGQLRITQAGRSPEATQRGSGPDHLAGPLRELLRLRFELTGEWGRVPLQLVAELLQLGPAGHQPGEVGQGEVGLGELA
jgi:hypothetical protein